MRRTTFNKNPNTGSFDPSRFITYMVVEGGKLKNLLNGQSAFFSMARDRYYKSNFFEV
jgi:hypothetical protein